MNTSTLGVVVGRFQVPELHAGHRHLITYAKERNEHVLIIVGSSLGLPSARNPLSFRERATMLKAEFPETTILEHHDHPSDFAWSASLDALIETVSPKHTVTLYGSRDSFIPYYHGTHRVHEVPAVPSVDGTTLRKAAQMDVPVTPDFRRGIIHVHATRLPIPYPAVDVAIVDPHRRMVLLGEKKRDGGKRRFIGGFFDPQIDESFEMAGRREVYEETSGVEVDGFTYLGSARIDDWRYRKDKDQIVSVFFRATFIFGAPRPGDDIDALHWTPYKKIRDVLVPAHRPFGELLLKSLHVR